MKSIIKGKEMLDVLQKPEEYGAARKSLGVSHLDSALLYVTESQTVLLVETPQSYIENRITSLIFHAAYIHELRCAAFLRLLDQCEKRFKSASFICAVYEGQPTRADRNLTRDEFFVSKQRASLLVRPS